MTETLLKTLDDRGVLTLTLNRPSVKNAIDEHLIATLHKALEEAHKSEKTRVLVLKGSDGFFCSGADLGWMKRMAGFSRDQNVEDAYAFARLMRLLDDFSRPTVAFVEGGAFGGGVGFAAACDITIVSDQALFSLSEVRLGLIPAVISPYVIGAIGRRQTKRLTLTAERFDAHKALALGLAHEVVPEDQMNEALERTLGYLLKGGPAAQKTAKDLFKLIGREKNTERIVDATATMIADIRASTEGREGVAAFLEKRNPSWVGG